MNFMQILLPAESRKTHVSLSLRIKGFGYNKEQNILKYNSSHHTHHQSEQDATQTSQTPEECKHQTRCVLGKILLRIRIRG